MLWYPDSCPNFSKKDGCVFDISHGANGEQILNSVIKKCSFHEKHGNQNVHSVVLQENRTRFSVVNEMVKRDKSLLKKNSEGEDVIAWDKIKINIDANDKFTIEAGNKIVEFYKHDNSVDAVNKGKNKNV